MQLVSLRFRRNVEPSQCILGSPTVWLTLLSAKAVIFDLAPLEIVEGLI